MDCYIHPFLQKNVTSRKRQREVAASQLDNELKSGGSSVSADSDVIKGEIKEMTDDFSRDKRYLLSSEQAKKKGDRLICRMKMSRIRNQKKFCIP